MIKRGMFDMKKWVPNLTIMNPLHSVGMKLFLTFFVSFVAIVVIMGVYSYSTSKQILQEKVAGASQQMIIQAKEKLDLIFGQYESLSLQFVLDQDFHKTMLEYINAEDGSFEELFAKQDLQKKLQSHLFTDESLYGFHFYQTDGNHVLSAVSTTDVNKVSEDNISREAWFQTAVQNGGKAVWIATWKDGFSGHGLPTFGLIRVVRDTVTTKDSIVLLMEIKMEALHNELAKIDMGNTDEKLVIDEFNQIIYAEDASMLGQSSKVNIPLDPETAATQISGSFISADATGAERLFVFDKSTDKTGWYIVGSVEVGELTRDMNRIFFLTIVMTLVAAVVAGLIGYFIIRTIGNPLKNLAVLMQKGQEGDLSVRTQVKSRDEIGQLGDSFNRMMEQLKALVEQTSISAQEVLATSTELSVVSKKTAMSAKEISVATEQIAGGASTLAVEAEKGNELTQNIGEQMKQVVQKNLEMGQAASEVGKVSEQGIQYMAELIEKTKATEQMTRSMVEKVEKLKESTASIRKILDVMTNVTQQTNILSLNAAIEASRAGAAGKGFMVVADEIRKLADQSRESIGVVGEITETIQREIDETVAVLSEAYPLFQEQTASVKEADQIFKNVQEEMEKFIRHLDEATHSVQQLEEAQKVLSEAMANVSAVSEEASATSQEVASLTVEQLGASDGLVQLAEQLETLSKSLQESLSRFDLDSAESREQPHNADLSPELS